MPWERLGIACRLWGVWLNYPYKRPVLRCVDVFVEVRPNTLLKKQSRCPISNGMRLLWHHYYTALACKRIQPHPCQYRVYLSIFIWDWWLYLLHYIQFHTGTFTENQSAFTLPDKHRSSSKWYIYWIPILIQYSAFRLRLKPCLPTHSRWCRQIFDGRFENNIFNQHWCNEIRHIFILLYNDESNYQF